MSFKVNMISFGANLKINDNIYNKLSAEGKASVKKVVEEYKAFVEHPKVASRTQGDTIELRRAKHIGGYALELEIKTAAMKEPYVTGVYTNEKFPNIKSNSLIFQTLLYLCFKIGEKPRFCENSLRFIDRVLYGGKLGWGRK